MSPPFPLARHTLFLVQCLPQWDSKGCHNCSANSTRFFLLHPFLVCLFLLKCSLPVDYIALLNIWVWIFTWRLHRTSATENNKLQKLESLQTFFWCLHKLIFLQLLSISSKKKKIMIKKMAQGVILLWIIEEVLTVLHFSYFQKCFTSSTWISLCLICWNILIIYISSIICPKCVYFG